MLVYEVPGPLFDSASMDVLVLFDGAGVRLPWWCAISVGENSMCRLLLLLRVMIVHCCLLFLRFSRCSCCCGIPDWSFLDSRSVCGG